MLKEKGIQPSNKVLKANEIELNKKIADALNITLNQSVFLSKDCVTEIMCLLSWGILTYSPSVSRLIKTWICLIGQIRVLS